MMPKSPPLPRPLLFILLIPLLLFSFATQAMGAACISLSKEGPATAVPGDTISFTFIVTNCGDVNFASGIAWVVDPLLSSQPLWVDTLVVGQSVTFSRDYQVTEEDCGELVNDATAFGSWNNDIPVYNPDSGVRDDDSWTVSVSCPYCGDGNLDPGEGCDDGNNADGDGCSAVCTVESYCGDGALDTGEECDDGNNTDGDGCSAACTVEPFCGDGVLDSGEECDDGNNADGDGCSAACTMELGGEGCTPGYWKQYRHFGAWPDPYTPNTMFSEVFEDAFPGMTLLDVLKLRGGGLNALGRHTVAALLNAASDDVNYDRSAVKVIDMFNAAYPGSPDDYEQVKNIFNFFNEQGCPLQRAELTSQLDFSSDKMSAAPLGKVIHSVKQSCPSN